MSLIIKNFQKHGDAKKEYVLLQATQDLNLKDYMVIDRTFDKEGKVSNIHRHPFSFPTQEVKKDQYVALMTGKGTPGLGKTNEGHPCHYFYFNSDAPIWNDTSLDKVQVLKVQIVDEHPKFVFKPVLQSNPYKQ